MTPSVPIFVACLAPVVGPLCITFTRRVRDAAAFFDGFSLVLVGGLSLCFLLPQVTRELGIFAVALAGVGLVLPSLFAGRRAGSHRVVVLVLGAHAMLDGVVLSACVGEAALAVAVVVHRLPVGFALVSAAREDRRGRATATAWGLSLLMVAATLVGFLLGSRLDALRAVVPAAAVEAVVAGLLLHVVFRQQPCKQPAAKKGAAAAEGLHPHARHGGSPAHAHSACGHHHEARGGHRHTARSRADQGFAALGALLAIGVLLCARAVLSSEAAEQQVSVVPRTLLLLLLESAPALVLGYALAGVVPFLLTPARTEALAQGGHLRQALRGVAFGLPLPVCSCGVLPLYESLVRRGVPPAAGLAFFVATPELGLDAVLLSMPLLGGSMTLARVAAAFVVAVLVAWFGAQWLSRGRGREEGSFEPPRAMNSNGSLSGQLRAGLRFGFVELFDHTMPWIALGLLVAAMAEPLLSQGALHSVPPFLHVPVAALVGIPLYVCASGATPLVALALHKGASAGAAVAFLIAGPATNLTTFGVLARLHGRGAAFRFGACIALLAMAAGWMVDALGVSAEPVLATQSSDAGLGSWLQWGCVALLAVLTAGSLLRQGPRGVLGQVLRPIHAH